MSTITFTDYAGDTAKLIRSQDGESIIIRNMDRDEGTAVYVYLDPEQQQQLVDFILEGKK
ncbi:hypothetical protein KIV65_gp15 [Mycobacterium phage Anthony]|uniref:Uncharacterized protein n=1 Tax=Mycobacterium phage Anthony TaxID=2599857 RepID=A0A5J6TNZ1_9CAUD|nr:hypothetical protein KIV65_gp15 [Mycobacterium phage Anthony]QFG10452.1 hypothetical protein PBI_ANTHONY_82 [Mycobacterium phage Anthony]